MESEVKKILKILAELDSKDQMKIISECLSVIGTKKWQDEVNDLIKRIENS